MLQPADITIAVTVFSRRHYLRDSIGSALNQSVPVRVIVVEDCGPDPGLEAHIKSEFGERIQYFRNPVRRGIFGNWNACMEHCRTPWLSILHDDDSLEPCFVEEMLRLSERQPGCGLYFGNASIVDHHGQVVRPWARPPIPVPSQRVQLEEMIWITPFPFPGQIFQIAGAHALGGFRATSQYCGDWEMWANLTAHYGAAQCQAKVAQNRMHEGVDRGTNQVIRQGRQYPLSIVQHRRILALLKRGGRDVRFDRDAYMDVYPMPTSVIARFGCTWSPALLRYHYRLLQGSRSINWRHFVVKQVSRVLGPRSLRLASLIYNLGRRGRG